MDQQDTPPRGFPIVSKPPPPPPQDRPKGLFGWIGRNPKRGFWVVLVAALLAGLAIGAVAGNGQTEIDKQRARADQAEEQATSAESERDELRTRAENAEKRASALNGRIKKLSAKGELPSFVGDDVGDVEFSDEVKAFDWKIKTTEQISDQQPGTVLSQSPAEGRTLKAGRSVHLVIAKKPPPKPKQWVTIKTLSGASSTKTDEFRVPSGLKARLTYEMPQDGNNAIILYRAPKEYIDLLLNEIGPQTGSTRLYEPGSYYLDVSGSYTIQVQVFKRP